MGQYNPHAPLVVGNEYAPVISAPYRPDLFVERGWSFKIDEDAEFRQASMFVDSLPGWSVPGHAYLITLYRRGQETATGPMKTVTVPLVLASSTNGVTGGGAPNTTTSIANPTDGWYFRLRSGSTGEAYLRLRSDTIPSFLEGPFAAADKRIVDVSILYTASAEPGNEAPVPLEINHYYEVNSERISYGTAEVDLIEPTIDTVRRSRWGEINTWLGSPSAFTNVTTRVPWNYNLLTLFETGDDYLVEFRTASAAQDGPREIFLHYAAMQITYCEENRVGVWGLALGADYDLTGDPSVSASDAAGGYRLGRNTQRGARASGFVVPNSVLVPSGGASVNFGPASADTRDITMTIKRADYGPYNNQGPPGDLRALRTVDLFPGHPGVVVNNTIEPGQTNTVAPSDLLPQIVMQDGDGFDPDDSEAPPLSSGYTYGVQTPLQVSSLSTAVQEIVQIADAPDTSHSQVRFWARHFEATAPLRVAIETPSQGPVTVAVLDTVDVDELPEIVDGWRRVTVEVDPALLIDDDGSVLSPASPRWESDTSPFRAWEVLGARVIDPTVEDAFNPSAESEMGIGTYGDDNAQGGIEGDLPDTADIDVSVVWGQAMPEVGGLTVAEAVQPVAVVDPECPIAPECIPDGIRYLRLEWEPVDSGYGFVGLGHYELQRTDDTLDPGEWETVATPIHPLVDAFDDYEARVGVTSRYRIRYVHQNGMTGLWSAEVVGEVAAPGVTGAGAAVGVLVFTSNTAPERNLAYAQVWTGSPAEDFEFPEAETRELQRLYGRDYQVAFRPVERGGTAFTRNLMVNAAAVPVETLEAGFRSLRDLAWAKLPYVCVRSDRGDRWLSNVNVPSGTIRRRKLYVAEVRITEVSDTPFAPEPTVCEGMTARGTLSSTIYEPRYATTPPSSALSSPDLSLRVQMRLDQFEQRFPLVARFNHVGFLGWWWQLETDNTLSFNTISGVDNGAFNTDPLPFGPGELFWVRVDYDADGAGTGASADFFTSTDGSTWDPLASTGSGDVVSASIGDDLPLTVGATFDGTADWVIIQSTGGSGGWNGVIAQMQMFDGPGGTLLADPDFADQDPDAETFTDSQGNPWTVAGGICTVDRRA